MRSILAILLASQLVGCIIESSDDDPNPTPVCGDGIRTSTEACDDGNNASGDGCSASCTVEGAGELAAITASWEFKQYPNTTVGCPAGYDTIAQYSQAVDASLTPVGQPEIDLWDCVDGTGTATDLEPGAYLGWVESTTNDGTGVYARSLSAYLDVTAQDASFATAIFDDAGYASLSWSLVGATSGQAVTCAQAQANGVSVLTTVTNGTDALDDVYDCEDGYAITSARLAGSYTFSVSAINAQEQALGEPVNRTNVIINDRNQVTDLGALALPIDGL